MQPTGLTNKNPEDMRFANRSAMSKIDIISSQGARNTTAADLAVIFKG